MIGRRGLSGEIRSRRWLTKNLRKLLREGAVVTVAVRRVVGEGSVLTVRRPGKAVAVGATHGQSGLVRTLHLRSTTAVAVRVYC